MNTQSLPCHFDEFYEFFQNNIYHVIVCSESWCKPQLESFNLKLPHHTLYRNDRIFSNGGGIAIYIHNSLIVKIILASESTERGKLEYLLLEVSGPQLPKILVGGIYRPPKAQLFNDFAQIISELATNYQYVILLGDLNVNMFEVNDESTNLKFSINALDLSLVNFNATHFSQGAPSWIDHIIINDKDLIVEQNQRPVPFLSNHDLISVTLSLQVPNYAERVITFRDFKNFDSSLFNNDLALVDWSPINNFENIDDKIEYFNGKFLDTLNKHAPFRTCKIKKPPAPWINDDIRALRKIRDKLRKELGVNDPKFKFARNKVTDMTRKSKSEFIKDKLNNNKSYSYVWRDLREYRIIKPLNQNSRFVPDVNELNNYFASVFNTSLPVALDNLEPVPNIADFDDNRFYFQPISDETLVKYIREIKTNAIGFDCIAPKHLKLALPSILPVLSNIINHMLINSVFPSQWKQAIVRPIPKVANPTRTADFRPISILPGLSKCVERAVLEQATRFVESQGLSNPYQSGFRKGYSTQTALAEVLENIRENIDNREVTVMVLFDFSKAFDTVNHELLQRKLYKLKFSRSAISWFRAYLANRRQAVETPDNRRSDWVDVLSGVAQGSLVGPFLFSLFSGDLPDIIFFCKHMMYADDFQIYKSTKPSHLAETLSEIQADVDRVSRWAGDNGLTLNGDKTQVIVFGSSAYLSKINLTTLPRITVNGVPINYSNKVKNLGVTLSDTLSWRPHVLNISKSVFKTLYQLNYNRSHLSFELRKNLVQSLVFPYFDYCSSLLTDITAEINGLLQRALNACCRFVFGFNRYQHVF